MRPGCWSWRAGECRSCCCTDTPTAPTPGVRRWLCWRGGGSARWQSTCPACAPPIASEPTPSCPSLTSSRWRRCATRPAGRPRQAVLAVGNSLGGCIALRLAERHGDRLAGVLGAAPAGLEMSRLLHLVQRDPLLRSLLALPTPVPAVVLRAAVARLYRQLAFHSPGSVEPAVISAFTWHHRRRARVAHYLDTAHRLVPELRQPYRLEQISVPVLLVWGDRDRIVFWRGAKRVLDAVPGSRLELLPGIGHCPQVEAAARFTDLLLDFRAEQTPAPG